MLPSLFWLSYADFTAILLLSSLVMAFVFFYSCRYGLRLDKGCAGGGGGHAGGRRAVFISTKKRPQKSFRVPVGRWGGVGRMGSSRKRPSEPVGRGVGVPPGSRRKRNKKHHFLCNALDQGIAT